MSSIITITLNPAIDKSTTVTELVPDKKLRCSPPIFDPGGGGVNVARAIKKINGNALAVYLAGGYTGKFLKELLDKETVKSSVIEIAGRTRENLVVQEKSKNLQYRFGMPGPEIKENEWKQLLAVLDQVNDVSFIVASGGVPIGAPDDIFASISSIAKKKNAKFIVDTSGDALKLALKEGVYLLKPNLGELSTLAGKEWIEPNEIEIVARQIINTGKCEVMVVSMGEAGAMLVTTNETFRITPPEVERKSTVGAGDSMVAGIVLSLSKGWPLLRAVQYGVACGTAATMNPGTELCRLNDVERLFSSIIK
ncbi:MAG: 1-phosphofructokinase family hexose kinase [Chitinophagaceae bacterium]|nr:MAG: 1-phosphofructokinase family hexose kinase [Chitinophagaceae bacterium]